jgi:hypothetical protein
MAWVRVSRSALTVRAISPPTDWIATCVASVGGRLAVTRISTPSSRRALSTCFMSAVVTPEAATNTHLAPRCHTSPRNRSIGPTAGAEDGVPLGDPVETKPIGRKPRRLLPSSFARCWASSLVPTISVSKVSLPSFQEWRICRCQRRRETVANTSASIQEHTTQRLE